MKLVTYRVGEEASRLGVYWESLIVDVEEFGFNVGLDLPASMLGFIDLGPIAVSALSEALSHSKIGDFCVLNTSSTIDHECEIGNGVHIMGGVCIAGRVKIGDYVSIGTNATIFPDLEISEGAFIGAGAVVKKELKKIKKKQVKKIKKSIKKTIGKKIKNKKIKNLLNGLL